jgi:asparagine synthase (glutamine-hydrolysing)
MAHRGPDDQGAKVVGRAAIGMRRLSIIDLAGGQQPMSGCEPRVHLVFNGEIYNFRELQRDLEERGHKFRTRSDTEAIAHAYEEFGDACVDRLRGMFAFAIWDERSQRLFAARDRAGEKPLYYTVTPDGAFVFGSELKCLLEHPGVRREIDPAALDAYLTFGYVPEPRSVFRGVFKLEAGHRLVFEKGRATSEAYWDFPVDREATARPEEEYVEELRARLDEAVRMMLIADVPLGAFLSGGVDSSAVVGLMSRATNAPVKTFSIGFREDSYDELKYARLAARHFETDHRELIVTPDVCRLVDELVLHYDEPFADQSSIPTYLVAKLAREHVTVALTGDGGDEVFAGYNRHVAANGLLKRLSALPSPVRSAMAAAMTSLSPDMWQSLLDVLPDRVRPRALGEKLHKLAPLMTLSEQEQYRRVVSHWNDPGELVVGDAERAPAIDADPPAVLTDAVERMRYLDLATYLPGDILTKVDRATMAASLEARAPLLDHRLVEWSFRVPTAIHIQNGQGKWLLRRILEKRVPPELFERPKSGFGIPLGEWLRGPLRDWAEDLLSESRLQAAGIRSEPVRRLWQDHLSGTANGQYLLWPVLMLTAWLEEWGSRSDDQRVLLSA